MAYTLTDTDLHQPLNFATFGNPSETTSGYATDVCRITFMKKGDETGDETQHNYNHRHVNDQGEQDEEEDEQLGG